MGPDINKNTSLKILEIVFMDKFILSALAVIGSKTEIVKKNKS